MLDKGREVWHNMYPRWGNKKVERESGQIGEGMMKADWEAERKRRRSGWKDDLAGNDLAPGGENVNASEAGGPFPSPAAS